jgi:hypothetical protein
VVQCFEDRESEFKSSQAEIAEVATKVEAELEAELHEYVGVEHSSCKPIVLQDTMPDREATHPCASGRLGSFSNILAFGRSLNAPMRP